MKKRHTLIGLFCALFLFSAYACGGTNSSEDKGTVNKPSTNSSQSSNSGNKPSSNLGNYNIVIDSCRLAKDYQNKDIVIVKFKFTNNDDDNASFAWTFNYNAFQNGVGLNKSYIVDSSANYSSDDIYKEIKKGVSLYVEVAYELNDSTSDIEVEVSELISLSNKKITKTFSMK